MITAHINTLSTPIQESPTSIHKYSTFRLKVSGSPVVSRIVPIKRLQVFLYLKISFGKNAIEVITLEQWPKGFKSKEIRGT